MAGIVGSAVANESVSKIFSILSGVPGEDETPEDRAVRLELAVLKIHGVVAVSDDWRIAHLPLLKWKAKLRSVAMEGDDILRRASTSRRRRRSATEQRRRKEESATARRTTIRAAKRFMPFAFGRAAGEEGQDDPSEATVRRFERLAGSADEFFRYVQSGGRRRPENLLVSFRVPAGLLLAGETLEISIRNGSQDALLLIHPWHGEGDAGRRDEVALFLSNDDDDSTRWEKNVKLSVVFRLSDHIDDMGMVVSSSLELLPPQFSALRVTMRELVGQVLAQGTSCYSRRPSAMSVWCGAMAWKCQPFLTEEKGSGDGSRLQLPSPIIKVDALCFASPLNGSSNTPPPPPADGGLPVKLMCHISPHLVPGKYSEKYDQIEPQTLRELLPAEGAVTCRGWWCPRSSTYLSMEPELSASPPSLRQLYLTENPERPAGVDIVVAEVDEEI